MQLQLNYIFTNPETIYGKCYYRITGFLKKEYAYTIFISKNRLGGLLKELINFSNTLLFNNCKPVRNHSAQCFAVFIYRNKHERFYQ